MIMDQSQTDNIFLKYQDKVTDFVFDTKVASVFDDMIRRSVPGYATVIAMTKAFADEYAQDNTVCYDLGSSLGASTLALRKGLLNKKGCRIVSVDNSPAMVERCTDIVNSDINPVPVDIIQDDIANISINNASVVVLNFTLQFFAPEARDALIHKIFNGMVPGGILILSEKIKFADNQESDFQIEMYHEFKKLNGYSDMEVSQKRKSLENVLISDTIKCHQDRLKFAGFIKSYLWFQCFNFISLAAFKSHV